LNISVCADWWLRFWKRYKVERIRGQVRFDRQKIELRVLFKNYLCKRLLAIEDGLSETTRSSFDVVVAANNSIVVVKVGATLQLAAAGLKVWPIRIYTPRQGNKDQHQQLLIS